MRDELFIDSTIGLGTLGLYWYILGLNSLFTPLPAYAGVAVILLILFFRHSQPIRLPILNKVELGLIGLLGLQMGINALGLRVPEYSFDAIWYHLPEAMVYANTGRIAKIPELMYSTMPRLGEVLLAPGFWHGSPKVMIFGIYLLFIAGIYRLGRHYLSKSQTLLFTIAINSFTLIAWQSTAGYVDILRSVFELASLLCLLNHKPGKAGVLIGFALSVKMQALIALIASLTLLRKKHILFLISALLVAFPWYYDNYLQSGNFFYPLTNTNLQTNLYTHSGTISATGWIIGQLIKLPLLPLHLALPSQQLSPLLLLFFPFLFFLRPTPKTQFLIPYTVTFLLLFWFLPPPESRYAITGISGLLLLEFVVIKKSKRAILIILFCVAINLAIRLGVTYQNLPLILGTISQTQYLESKTTNFNRNNLNMYYNGFWSDYHYH